MGETRKICLFIVEGIADESSLALPLQNIFDSYYKQKGIEFQITNGDITSRNGTTVQNIVAKIGKAVTNFLNRHHLQKKDIYQVVQIVDMDGTYIENSGVVFDASKSFSQYPFYGENKIFVQSPEKISLLQERNCRKSQNLERIISLPQVMGIPYDIYYFSCNMDHVLHDNANMDDTKKVDEAEKFADKFGNDSEGFLGFIESVYPKSVDCNKEKSWEYIRMKNNSLTRCSNFILFFDHNQ